MNRLLVISVLMCSLTTSACRAAEERLLDAADYRLFVKVENGAKADMPAIVLESGFGFSTAQWSELQPQLAKKTGATVVSYDRPGFGKSPLPDRPYDITAEAEALHAALIQLGLAKNVLFVGHSYGGLPIQIYANKWPATTRGLVFLDPNTPAVMMAAAAEMTPKVMANPTTPEQRAANRIYAAGMAPFSAAFQAPLPLDVPVIVVSADISSFKDPRVTKIFALAQELLASSVRDGKVVKAEGSGHMITMQRPDLVISSVEELLAKAKEREK